MERKGRLPTRPRRCSPEHAGLLRLPKFVDSRTINARADFLPEGTGEYLHPDCALRANGSRLFRQDGGFGKITNNAPSRMGRFGSGSNTGRAAKFARKTQAGGTNATFDGGNEPWDLERA